MSRNQYTAEQRQDWRALVQKTEPRRTTTVGLYFSWRAIGMRPALAWALSMQR